MTTTKKALIFLAGMAALGGIVAVSLSQQGKNRVTVQTARAGRADIDALVTASGEITPKTYADISANAMGQITDLDVKEGDHVKTGQLLAKLWNVQQAASVAAMDATVKTFQANVEAQRAALVTSQAQLERDSALLDQQLANWKRTQQLFADKLLARSDFETAQANYQTAVAQEKLSAAGLKQAQANLDSMVAQTNEAAANLKSAADVLDKTQFTSPLDGIVTYLPVHIGDTVVMGIQNSPGSVLMRVADMSVVTAEVQVDETDIANVHIGQAATMTIDAFGDQKFPGKVTEVGDTAILRSTGAAATSTSGSDAQQAKDFKVVVTLDAPPPDIRPGLSCTAQITTATARAAVSVPLQALVERNPAELNPPQPGTAQAGALPAAGAGDRAQPVQGLFVVHGGAAEFIPARTGVTGIDHIQVLSGVQPGDEIVTGPYKALRSIANHAKIKVDNTVQPKPDAADGGAANS